MTNPFVAISRSSTPQAIEEQIKSRIVARELVAGDALPAERDFAAQFGVSRSTLREALRALTEEGIIVAKQGSGWVVQPNRGTAASNLAVYFRLEDVTLAQLMEARASTEPTIARLAADRRTDEQFAAITATFERLSAINAAAEFVRVDSDFHGLIAIAAGNPLLSFAMLPTMSLLEEVRIKAVRQRGSIAASQAEHERIVAAIGAGNADEAESVMREHITRFNERTRKIARTTGR